MNSLTDRDVIDKIAEACEAGVHITMIVRGICCIKAGVPGKTDGLVVRQIVGRFLEHARVYAFGPEADTIYLSSADMMTRNTERRVEIAYPVLDPTCRALVTEYMRLQESDNVKARQLTAEGTWRKIPVKQGDSLVNAQDALCARATKNAREAADAAAAARRHAQAKPMPVAGPSVDEKPVEAAGQKTMQPPVASHTALTAQPAPAPQPVSQSAAAKPNHVAQAAPQALRPSNRVAEAFGMIGAGFRMLFGGRK